MPETNEWEQTLFTLILHAGNARSQAVEAAEKAAEGDWEAAEALLQEADDEQLLAHEVQAKLIRGEAAGQELPFSALFVHALDLLVLAWAEIDHTRQLVGLYRRVAALEGRGTSRQKSRK